MSHWCELPYATIREIRGDTDGWGRRRESAINEEDLASELRNANKETIAESLIPKES